MKLTKLSQTMSYALRHKPENFGIVLTEDGFVTIKEFSQKLDIPVPVILQIVEEDEKQRYTIKDGMIRAAQGHSIKVKIPFEQRTAPATLWHGTNEEALKTILKTGLLPMSRQYVHLSENKETATNVASRRKSAVVLLKIDTQKLQQTNELVVSENNVWLTTQVPTDCITIEK